MLFNLQVLVRPAATLLRFMRLKRLYSSSRGIEIFSCCIAFSTVSLQVYTVVRCRSIWRNIPHLEPCRVFGKGFVLRVLAFTVCQLFLFVYVTS